MKLDRELLKSYEDCLSEEYHGCINARGMYSSMQFVLRLSPNIHSKLENISKESSISISTEFDFDTIQAYSTYIHETIHWWQHVGSNLGFMLSLSYPAQAQINFQNLLDHIKLTGTIKPITKYNESHAQDFLPKDKEFIIINNVLNNYFDIEFFKYHTINPQSLKETSKNKYFESVGHSYYIAYHSFVNLLSSTVDKKLRFLPRIDKWPDAFSSLSKKKITGHYYGSPISIPPIGLKEIFEGQACFAQIQYLHFGSGGSLTWKDLEDIGMLSGVYYKAFDTFLEQTNSEKPDSIDSPLVALFMLVLDIAMNPTDGFPFDILHYESFITSVDPGFRFFLLCKSIETENQDLKTLIKSYSSSEYIYASQRLSSSINCRSPWEGSSHICGWLKNETELITLMKEESTFIFSKENMPIRLMFSKFLEYQKSKVENPAFFCWPGVYCAGQKLTHQTLELFLAHQSLFADREDGNVYPRLFPGKTNKAIQDTFDLFYSWITTYDLCSQWIATPGEFKFDYNWLSNKFTTGEQKEWAKHHFKNIFAVNTDSFTIL